MSSVDLSQQVSGVGSVSSDLGKTTRSTLGVSLATGPFSTSSLHLQTWTWCHRYPVLLSHDEDLEGPDVHDSVPVLYVDHQNEV